MSKYTTEVRFICETYAGYKESQGYDKIDEIVESSRRSIFGEYPIFDEAYRGVLEKKILKHYYTREISEETVGLWKLRLNNRMNEIMPYFNKLYNSELIQFNPLYDVDLTRDFKRKTDGSTTSKTTQTTETSNSGESETTVDNTDWNLFNDTPQGGITGIDTGAYLTNATKITADDTTNNEYSGESSSESNIDNTGTMNGIEDYLEHVKGTNGGMSYSKRLQEFRDTFLNIDLQIIDNLKNLFFYLW